MNDNADALEGAFERAVRAERDSARRLLVPLLLDDRLAAQDIGDHDPDHLRLGFVVRLAAEMIKRERVETDRLRAERDELAARLTDAERERDEARAQEVETFRACAVSDLQDVAYQLSILATQGTGAPAGDSSWRYHAGRADAARDVVNACRLRLGELGVETLVHKPTPAERAAEEDRLSADESDSPADWAGLAAREEAGR